ncbi:Globin [Methylocella tundrae]|uniref:Globin n=1 Tax=Methylocella tundrae TaxID=227605 RepID=A0A8B6M5M8_METTU|nr:group II truncated hemoglobin [Methylocella tundrae]VTZ27773.1 Globin [Methylocella tundrae]VTZ50307.1 Globin [Methylocella tundrae]
MRALRQMQSLYEKMGGEEEIRRLVETFYDIVETDPEAKELHLLHLRGHGVAHSRIEQFNFLSGFLGGPQYYVQKYGHAHLREMHAHVPIGRKERDLWLACMTKAIAKVGLGSQTADRLMRHFTRAAEGCRNQD